MTNDSSQSLAEKIARLLESESPRNDISSIQAGIEKINQRLEKIESEIALSKPLTSYTPAIHPSQARFTLAEAIADAIVDSKTKEKACTFEPNGKPCDHCGMCSSRGF